MCYALVERCGNIKDCKQGMVMKNLLFLLSFVLFVANSSVGYCNDKLAIPSQDKQSISIPEPDFKYDVAPKSFFDWINSNAFAKTIDKDEEKKIARKVWRQSLGVDIFYPYFQVKKAKKIIESKTEIKLFSMKGKASISDDEVKYIFRKRF